MLFILQAVKLRSKERSSRYLPWLLVSKISTVVAFNDGSQLLQTLPAPVWGRLRCSHQLNVSLQASLV